MSQLKLPVPHETDFRSRLRSPAVASRVGLWLGVCFALAFLTGVFSHLAQAGYPWFPLPTRPAWLYRVTQGLHVAAGTAAVPLLLVKLWSVFPKLFARPPRERRALIAARARAGLDRGARRGGDLPARDRPGQLSPVVPVGVLLPGHPLRRRLGRDRRARWCTSR